MCIEFTVDGVTPNNKNVEEITTYYLQAMLMVKDIKIKKNSPSLTKPILGLLHKVGSLAKPCGTRCAFRLTLNLERQGGQQNVFSLTLDALGLMPNLRQCTKT